MSKLKAPAGESKRACTQWKGKIMARNIAKAGKQPQEVKASSQEVVVSLVRFADDLSDSLDRCHGLECAVHGTEMEGAERAGILRIVQDTRGGIERLVESFEAARDLISPGARQAMDEARARIHAGQGTCPGTEECGGH